MEAVWAVATAIAAAITEAAWAVATVIGAAIMEAAAMAIGGMAGIEVIVVVITPGTECLWP
jgi:hypothetical protein